MSFDYKRSMQMLCAKKTACVYSQRRCWWWKVRERAACAISWRYSCLRGQTQTECCARWARRARLIKSGWWNSRLRFVALRTACSARSPPRGQTHKRCNRGQCGVHATPRTHTARHPRVENWNLDRLSSPSYLNAAAWGFSPIQDIYRNNTRARMHLEHVLLFVYFYRKMFVRDMTLCALCGDGQMFVCIAVHAAAFTEQKAPGST